MKGKVELIYLSDDIVGTAWINGDECRLEFINDKTGDKYFPTDNELAVVHDVVWELVEKRIAERDSDEPFTIDASTFHI